MAVKNITDLHVLGNVGIGTTIPTSQLTLSDPISPTLEFNRQGSTANGWIKTTDNSQNVEAAIQMYGNEMRFYTSSESSQRMVINAAGNVGIGTTSPGHKLHVVGTTYTSDDLLVGIGNAISWHRVSIHTGGFIAQSGNKGIGVYADGTDSNNNLFAYDYDSSSFKPLKINASTLNITNGTSSVIYHDGTNVGIGTTSPASKLTLYSETHTDDIRMLASNGGTTNSYLGNFAGGTYLATNYYYNGSQNSDDATKDSMEIYLGQDNFQLNHMAAGAAGARTSRISVISSGNVGIGAANPAYKLDVNGGIQLNGKSALTNNAYFVGAPSFGFRWNNSADTFNNVIMYDNGNMYVRGNVGIGTTNPNTKLHIVEPSSTSPVLSIQNSNANGYSGSWLYDSAGTLVGHFGWANGTTTTLSNKMYFGTIANKDVVFTTNDTEKVRITATGNVGIGTTSPILNGVLTVVQQNSAGLGSTDLTLNHYYAGTKYIDFGWYDSSIGNISNDGGTRISINSSNGLLLNPSSGNVGIGTTSPFGRLNVSRAGINEGAISFDDEANNAHLVLAGTDALVRMQLGTYNNGGFGAWIQASYDNGVFNAGTLPLILNPQGGNVGIGTTAPVDKLQVQGGNLAVPAGVIYNGAAANSAGLGLNNAWFDASGYYGVRFFSSTATVGSQTERMRITNTGNVGIGTTSPGAKLDVRGDIRFGTGGSGSFGEGLLTMNSGWGTNKFPTLGSYDGSAGSLIMLHNPHIPFRTDNAASGYTGRAGLRMAIDEAATNYWDAGLAGDFYHILRGGNELFRITSAGNVGIGTTSPAYTLTVQKSITNDWIGQISNTYNGAGNGLLIDAGNGSSGEILRLRDKDGSSKVSFLSNGRVGIGTTSPAARLHVKEQSGSTSQIKMSAASNEANYGYLTMLDNTVNTAKLTFGTTYGYNTPVDAMTIFNGNVGIGTTDPTGKLDIRGTSYFRNSSYLGVTISPDVTGADMYFYEGNSPVIYLQSSGDNIFNNGHNFGIGTTSPGFKLQANHGSTSEYVSSFQNTADNLQIKIGTTTGALLNIQGATISTNTAYNIALQAEGGNVGIGTTSPTYKLHVSGNAYINETLFVNQLTTIEDSLIVYDNVGIGTTSPGAKLDVRGDVSLYASGQFSDPFTASWRSVFVGSNATIFARDAVNLTDFVISNNHYVENQSSSPVNVARTDGKAASIILVNDEVKFIYDSTSRSTGATRTFSESMRISGGNVGIGTTSPTRKLHVVDSVWDNSAGGGVIFENSNTVGASLTLKPSASVVTNGSNGWAMYAGGPGAAIGDGNLGFWAHGTNDAMMMITRGGNVGIGTTSPASKLDVRDGDITVIRTTTGQANFGGPVIKLGDTTSEIGMSGGISFTELLSANPDSVTMGMYYDGKANKFHITGSSSTEDTTGENLVAATKHLTVTRDNGNVGIGTTSPSEKLEVNGNILASGDITAFSDARIKENIETLPNALESIKAMRGVTYNKIGEEKQSIGVIAQEVQAVLPQLVSEHNDGMLSVAYGNVTAVLIEAIKEQQKQIDELKALIDNK